jgi:hypothetical protein
MSYEQLAFTRSATPDPRQAIRSCRTTRPAVTNPRISATQGPSGRRGKAKIRCLGAGWFSVWFWCYRSGENRPCVLRSDAEPTVVPMCLDISMVVEGFHGNRGLLPSSTRVRLLN